MKNRKLNTVRFASGDGKNHFHDEVVSKVNEYFETKRISPYADGRMWVKTAIMLSLYFAPYLFIVTGVAQGNSFILVGLWGLMALGMIGIGTSVMHDAHHGTYSKNSRVNKFMGSILEIIGGYAVTWKIQHNTLHHTYTNIAGLDDDIDSIILLRFSPRQKRYWFHRYQYLYVWFFYMMMTLFWMTAKDYLQVVRYKQHNLLVKHKVSLTQAIFRITVYKLFYYSYVIVLPILFSGFPWYYIIGGFLLMHAIAGLILSCIFQPSHIIESSTFEEPHQKEGRNEMLNSWAVHEIENTIDFAQKNRFLTWWVGGLNFQIEHHLFTNVCHVHFPKIAPIVKEAAKKFGIKYHVKPTFWQAFAGHVKMLKALGNH